MNQWNKYEPTAARKHGKLGRESRPKSITIDVHSHVGVPRAAEFVKPHLAATAMPLVTFSNAETKALNQKQEADIIARAPLEKRLADLDAMGLDMQIIKPPPPQCYYAVPLEIAVQSAQMVTTALPSSSRASRTAPGSSRPSFKAPRDAASGMPGVNGNASNTSRVRHT